MNKVNEFDNINTCTDNYASQKERMGELSIADLCRTIDLIAIISGMIDHCNEIQDTVDDVLEPLYAVIRDLRVDDECPHCGRFLYKSDLPQYEFVCPCCDENF